MFLSDLEELEDVSNFLIFEEEPTIFTEEYAIEMVETALRLMDEYMEESPHIITEPHFHDILLEEIKDLFYIQMEDYIEGETLLNSEDIEDDMNDLLEDAFHIFITTFYHTDCDFKLPNLIILQHSMQAGDGMLLSLHAEATR